ncbi:hypothetical protein D3C76_869910 [compost metagenome]
MVTCPVAVHLLIFSAHCQHRAVGDVPFQYAICCLLFQGLAINVALAVGVRCDEATSHIATFRQRAGHIKLLTVVVPRARFKGQLTLCFERRLLANQVHGRAGIAGAGH